MPKFFYEIQVHIVVSSMALHNNSRRNFEQDIFNEFESHLDIMHQDFLYGAIP